MGISSSTRRVTVVNDNQSGVIRISESVIQKMITESHEKTGDSQSSHEDLRQQPTQPSVQPSVQQSHQITNDISYGQSMTSREEHVRELRALEKSWKNRVEELQKQNRQLWRTANDKLVTNISDVEKHLIQSKCQPICRQNERQVVQCYQTNRSQPLKCSQEVKRFIDCVHEVRTTVLNANG